jgi:mRNA interferase RelE/StbE
MYRVQLSLEAEKAYRKANTTLAKKLARCLERLEENPRNHPNVKALKGDYSGYYRYRVGDYRVVYSVDDQARIVNIIVIAHRSRVYE